MIVTSGRSFCKKEPCAGVGQDRPLSDQIEAVELERLLDLKAMHRSFVVGWCASEEPAQHFDVFANRRFVISGRFEHQPALVPNAPERF